MNELKVKSKSPPQRCEICHQADCFDVDSNYCSRCGDIEQRVQVVQTVTTRVPYTPESKFRESILNKNYLTWGWGASILGLLLREVYHSINVWLVYVGIGTIVCGVVMVTQYLGKREVERIKQFLIGYLSIPIGLILLWILQELLKFITHL